MRFFLHTLAIALITTPLSMAEPIPAAAVVAAHAGDATTAAPGAALVAQAKVTTHGLRAR